MKRLFSFLILSTLYAGGTFSIASAQVPCTDQSGKIIECPTTDQTIVTTPDPTTTLDASGDYYLLEPIGGLKKVGADFKVRDWVNTMVKVFIGIIGVLAVVMIVVGGVQYMTTDAIGKKESGKETITGAIAGVILALGSVLLLRTINPQLASVQLETGSVQTKEASVEINSELVLKQDTDSENLEFGNEGYSGERKTLCTDAASCRPICQKYCSGGKCKIPDNLLPWPGVFDDRKAVSINQQKITGIKPTGHVASPGVITGLKNFDSSVKKLIANGSIPSGTYELDVRSGFRPLYRQLELACNKLDAVGGSIASPGASPHGIGYAIDLKMYKNGSLMNQCDLETSRLIDRIMTEAGWTRFGGETWHYEWQPPANSPKIELRCKYPNCPHPKARGDYKGKTLKCTPP